MQPTGRERTFPESEVIVSKTDLKGHITYANQTFLNIAGFREAEILGKPHNIIRHPAMPRCVFQLLWDTLAAGQEIFAYVLNMARNGDHYWVFAHVTPTFDANGKITGYHSNRRVPDRSAIEKIQPVYAALLAEEEKHSSKKDAIQAGTRLLLAALKQQGLAYEEFVFTL